MNHQPYNEAGNLHSIFQILQTIEVGLFVLDRNNTVQLWNSFMENHSGIRTAQAKEKDLFQLFPYLPRKWVQRKIDFVFNLKSRAYSTWEQRPHLFQFSSGRPLTSRAPLMFQNITLTPLLGADGEVAFVCFQVHDVTEIAVNKQALENANYELKR